MIDPRRRPAIMARAAAWAQKHEPFKLTSST